MTRKTRKYCEISEIFARFAILTKFMSIDFELGNYKEHHEIQLLGEFCEFFTG